MKQTKKFFAPFAENFHLFGYPATMVKKVTVAPWLPENKSGPLPAGKSWESPAGVPPH